MIWKKLAEEPAVLGHRKILRKIFELPTGKKDVFDVYDDGATVCILAFTDDRQIILAKQFRPGPERILLELPGGMIDKNETPIEAARRELLEETGYTGSLVSVNVDFVAGYSTQARHNFVATGCHRLQEPQPDPCESIEVVLMSLDDFRAHLRSGELTDVATGYLGLEFLGLL